MNDQVDSFAYLVGVLREQARQRRRRRGWLDTCHLFLLRGKIVEVEEGGLIPMPERFAEAQRRHGLSYRIPVVTYFPHWAIHKRSEWWGGWISWPAEGNIMQVKLKNRAKAERWLRRAKEHWYLPFKFPLEVR